MENGYRQHGETESSIHWTGLFFTFLIMNNAHAALITQDFGYRDERTAARKTTGFPPVCARTYVLHNRKVIKHYFQ